MCVQVLNKLDEFEDAVRKTVRDVRFDNDVVVSVFETNIRVLGYETCEMYIYILFCAFSWSEWICIFSLKFWLKWCLSSGLLGGHFMADLLRQRGERMQWYRDELLHMATELGHRLLPAFNTTSGLPYPKVVFHFFVTGLILNVGDRAKCLLWKGWIYISPVSSSSHLCFVH